MDTPPRDRRWVSLAPSCTEVLFDVGTGPSVAGVCAPAGSPPEAAGIPVVASWEGVAIERVVALKPSACFTVEGMQTPETLGALRRFGLTVAVYPMRSMEDLWACYLDVGRRTGREREARNRVEGYQKRIAAASAGLGGEPLPAVAVVGLDPVVAAGGGSFLDGVLAAAGFRNALAGRGEAYPAVSLEDVVQAAPAALVFPAGEFPAGSEARFLTALNRVLARPAVALRVPADTLVRPGPRTVEAVEALARARRAMGEGGP